LFASIDRQHHINIIEDKVRQSQIFWASFFDWWKAGIMHWVNVFMSGGRITSNELEINLDANNCYKLQNGGNSPSSSMKLLCINYLQFKLLIQHL
jgi:hypothetical protein